MERLNYGLAISGSGEYQVISTVIGPGVKDSYSTTRSESFTFLVAPHRWIDNNLGIASFSEEEYLAARDVFALLPQRIRDLILSYHGVLS